MAFSTDREEVVLTVTGNRKASPPHIIPKSSLTHLRRISIPQAHLPQIALPRRHRHPLPRMRRIRRRRLPLHPHPRTRAEARGLGHVQDLRAVHRGVADGFTRLRDRQVDDDPGMLRL